MKDRGTSMKSQSVARKHTQYLPMSREEEWSFVKSHYTMILSSVDSFGLPHSTPIWYVVIENKIYFRAQAYKKKVRNILKNPQVSLVVEDGDLYTELRGVMIQGIARIVDHDKQRRNQVFSILAEKYSSLRDTQHMPKEWREKYGKEHRLVIEITPKNLVSWDNRKWLEKPRKD
ncbi:MAG: pyridoxamine 5'-phosphate oxidase family protein [Nitrososphaerales archaeon]